METTISPLEKEFGVEGASIVDHQRRRDKIKKIVSTLTIVSALFFTNAAYRAGKIIYLLIEAKSDQRYSAYFETENNIWRAEERLKGLSREIEKHVDELMKDSGKGLNEYAQKIKDTNADISEQREKLQELEKDPLIQKYHKRMFLENLRVFNPFYQGGSK